MSLSYVNTVFLICPSTMSLLAFIGERREENENEDETEDDNNDDDDDL